MSENDHFTLILRWSEDQHVYIGQVQEMVSVEGTGNTYEEALASTLEGMRWWREMTGEGSSSPISQMLMEDTPDGDAGEEPPQSYWKVFSGPDKRAYRQSGESKRL